MECKTLLAQLEDANNNILSTGQVTDIIQTSLIQFIEQIRTLGNPSATKGMNLPEFYYYHATRVLRLVFMKALDRFAHAKIRLENPQVAKDFKALMPRIIDLCTTIENASQFKDEELKMRVLEKMTDKVYEEALDRNFMFTPDEEMDIDNISGESLNNFLALVQ